MWKHCKCSKDYDLGLVWNLISIIINKSLHLLYKKLILVSFVLANLLLIFQLQQRTQLCIWDCRAVLWLFEIFLEKTVNCKLIQKRSWFLMHVWSYNSAIEGNYIPWGTVKFRRWSRLKIFLVACNKLNNIGKNARFFQRRITRPFFLVVAP